MKHIKEYFHWLFVVAPLVSTIIAIFWGTDERIVEFIIIPAAVVLNFLIIGLKSYLDANDEQSLIRSFLTDDLLPNKSGRPLEFQAKIVMIEDEASGGSFIKNLAQQFKSKTESKERNLILIPFSCGTSNIESQKRKLINKLEGANAVVVIRTKELEEKSWVYDAIDSWAYERSDVPILFTEIDERDGKSSIPDRYFSIPVDSKSLPWRLLQRANERGYEWRSVASFNRLIATNFIILLVMSFCISHFLISHHKNEDADWLQSHHNSLQNQQKESYKILNEIYDGSNTDNAFREIYDGIARRTKEQFEESIMKSKDHKLVVSYWIRDDNKIRPYGTTDEHSNRTNWDFDKTTVIGCAFSHPLHFVKWDGKSNPDEPDVIPFNGGKLKDHGCHFFGRQIQDIKSIVCAAYSSPESGNKNTVGICIFTESANNISNYDYHEFLKEKTREFYEFALPLLEKKRIKRLINYDKVWEQISSSVDMRVLADELSKLLFELRRRATEPAHEAAYDQVIIAIGQAAIAAREDDGPRVLQHLRRGGMRAFQVATEIELRLAAETIKKILYPPQPYD